MAFLLNVVKAMSSKMTYSASQCFRISVLLVSDGVGYYHMPDSVVLTRKRELVTQTFQHTNRIEPRRGFKITEKEINGLLNP